MIYTVTFNPSLDYIVTVPAFHLRNGQPDIRGEDFSGWKRNQCIHGD